MDIPISSSSVAFWVRLKARPVGIGFASMAPGLAPAPVPGSALGPVPGLAPVSSMVLTVSV